MLDIKELTANEINGLTKTIIGTVLNTKNDQESVNISIKTINEIVNKIYLKGQSAAMEAVNSYIANKK